MNPALPRLPRSSFMLPAPVIRALRKLGHDIRDARRRRRIPAAVLAQRASICRTTLNRVEKGGPGVAAGSYASVLFPLGLPGRLAEVAGPRLDAVGRELEQERLPQRIPAAASKPPRSGWQAEK
jgi:DNA-binding XRE family transcriptional regulator